MPKCKNCKHLKEIEGERCWCPINNDSYDLSEDRDCSFFIVITNRDRILRWLQQNVKGE